MTRFLYIADSHMGASPMGYEQQKGYPEKLPEILSALHEHLSDRGGVDFILHGGDMIDRTSETNIMAAAAAFDLAVPVYLCLGNHDLTTPDAADPWLALAPQFFIGGTPDYSIVCKDCVIHVAPNHWCERPFYWKDTQSPRLSAGQVQRLSHELGMMSHLPHILLTHSPVYGVPVEQTGLSAPLHVPDASFTAEITSLARAHANLQCVLGAHTHMNMRVRREGVEYVTVSALVESPFEFKLFEVTPQRIDMTTISLRPALPFEGEYDSNKFYVQGRARDRSFATERR